MPRPAASHVNPPSLLPPSLCCQAWELLEAPPSAQPTRPVHEAILILLWGPLSSRCEPIACSSMLTPCSHCPPALLSAAQCGALNSFWLLLPSPTPVPAPSYTVSPHFLRLQAPPSPALTIFRLRGIACHTHVKLTTPARLTYAGMGNFHHSSIKGADIC